MFFSPFSIAITSLGEERERANLSAFRTFVRFVLVRICWFPLPLRVWEGLWIVIVALPGLFSYLFFFFFFFFFFLINLVDFLPKCTREITFVTSCLLFCTFFPSPYSPLSLPPPPPPHHTHTHTFSRPWGYSRQVRCPTEMLMKRKSKKHIVKGMKYERL